MAKINKEPENAPLVPALEPVKRLSPSFQRKLLKRAHKQRKQFRSSGKSYPLVSMQSPTSVSEKKHMLGSTILLILAELD
jgi:hypothetical protein